MKRDVNRLLGPTALAATVFLLCAAAAQANESASPAQLRRHIDQHDAPRTCGEGSHNTIFT